MTGALDAALGLAPLLLTGLAIAYTSAVWFIVHRLRHPPRRTYSWAVSRGVAGDPGELDAPRAFDAWSFRWTGRGGRALELPVWEMPGDDAGGPIVVCTPGWGDSRLGALARAPALLAVASRVVAWDPPGLGEGEGLCALGTDEPAALAALLGRVRAAHAAPVVLYGWSLGAGVSLVAAAADAEVRGVIAESPYCLPQTPARNVLRLSGMPHRLTLGPAFALLGLRLGAGARWRGFDRAGFASRVPAPVLVLHGSEDAISPPSDGAAVAAAAARGTLAMIEGAGHNDLWTEPRFAGQSAEIVRGFLRSLGSAAPAPFTGSPASSGGSPRR